MRYLLPLRTIGLSAFFLLACGSAPGSEAVPQVQTAAAQQAPAPPATPPSATRPSSQPLPPGPVKADPEKINFGFVKPGEELHGSFKLRNPLDHAVRIDKAVPSCQCTGIDAEGKEIPAKGELEVHFSMRMSKAPVHKFANVTLVMNSIKQAIRVEFEAEVSYPIRAVPNFVDAQKGHLVGTFRIQATDGKPFRVTAVQGAAPSFEGFDPVKDQPRSDYVLRYDFSAPGYVVPPYLVVETDREDCQLLDLRVRHETTQIKPACKPAEFRSTLGRLKPGEVGTFDLELEDMGATRVTSVRSLWDGATVELTGQKADGKSVLASLKVTPKPGLTGLLFFQVEFKLSNGATYPHIVVGAIR